jgi:hypothetical protein
MTVWNGGAPPILSVIAFRRIDAQKERQPKEKRAHSTQKGESGPENQILSAGCSS